MSAPECLAALTIASRAARTRACTGSEVSQSPTITTSTGTPRSSSTSAAAAVSAALRVSVWQLLAVQPGPQLALLAAGQLLDGLGIVGLPLDQGQGLQHRVMQVRGHVGPGVGADLLRAGLVQRGTGSVQPGRQHDASPARASVVIAITSGS